MGLQLCRWDVGKFVAGSGRSHPSARALTELEVRAVRSARSVRDSLDVGTCGFLALCSTNKIWVWVKIEPPGIGPQVVVHVSICQGSIWVPILTHSYIMTAKASLLLPGSLFPRPPRAPWTSIFAMGE